MNYFVSDLVIRIKNAAMAKRRDVVLPYSKTTLAIAKVLQKEGFLKSAKEGEVDGKKVVLAEVAYDRRIPVLTDVEVISKPSMRVYIRAAELVAKSKRGYKTLVLSTNQGIMTGKEAQKAGLGGELLFEIQ